MVRYNDQQGWKELEDFITIGVDEVKNFFTVCSEGFFKAKPMQIFVYTRLLSSSICGRDKSCLPC
jgi:hypothetical protein